jgi:uncharacterized protein (TIGR03067 family)
MRMTALLLLWIRLVGQVQAADPAAADRRSLDGVWEVVAAEQDGRKIPAGLCKKMAVKFIKGETVEITVWDGNVLRHPITLEATKPVKEIDFKESADEKGFIPGIYSLDQDALKLWFATIPKPRKRPTEFKTNREDRGMLLVLKRVKK